MDPNTPNTGAGEALPAASPTTPAIVPKNDAEAAALEAATPPPPVVTEPSAEEKARTDAAEKQKNRTRDYINRINRDNADLRQRYSELEARVNGSPHPQAQPRQPAPDDIGPTLEQFNYDLNAHQQARDKWLLQRAQQVFQQGQQQADLQRQQHQILTTYEQRAASFAEAHPDFLEAVGSIDTNFLSPELQLAVLGHERGPEIAYHLANDEEALWHLASIRADLLPAAVSRLASRLSAAPPPSMPGNPPVPIAAIAPTPPKPITQAPPPAPTVGGRSPTEIPAEKLTDDQWYARDKELRRKR